MIWENILKYLIVMVSGGIICAIAQILIIKTTLTPARILVIFLVAGVILEAVGAFEPIKEFCKAGVTTPIMGFGATLAKGAIDGARTSGFFGAFSGGLVSTSYGIGVAVALSFLVAVIFTPKTKVK